MSKPESYFDMTVDYMPGEGDISYICNEVSYNAQHIRKSSNGQHGNCSFSSEIWWCCWHLFGFVRRAPASNTNFGMGVWMWMIHNVFSPLFIAPYINSPTVSIDVARTCNFFGYMAYNFCFRKLHKASTCVIKQAACMLTLQLIDLARGFKILCHKHDAQI